jgi:enoyl-CoA hydratase/carnithine racemase
MMASSRELDLAISAVNGICQAGGLLIALLSDICVGSDRATFRVPELLRGIPDATYAAVLPAHVGVAVARDLMLSGRPFDAHEAQRLGVISRVVPHDELRAAAVEAARQVLRTPPDARLHFKRMLNEHYGPGDDPTMFWALDHSAEPREGMRAFMVKRQPNWIPEE